MPKPKYDYIFDAIWAGDLEGMLELLPRQVVELNRNKDLPLNYLMHYPHLFEKLGVPLIENGAFEFINYRGSKGNTALHVICEKGYVDIAKILLDYGAQPDIPNDKGIYPFQTLPLEWQNTLDDYWQNIDDDDIAALHQRLQKQIENRAGSNMMRMARQSRLKKENLDYNTKTSNDTESQTTENFDDVEDLFPGFHDN